MTTKTPTAAIVAPVSKPATGTTVAAPPDAPVNESPDSLASPANPSDVGDVAASSATSRAAMGARVTPESAAADKSEYAEAWGMDPTVC